MRYALRMREPVRGLDQRIEYMNGEFQILLGTKGIWHSVNRSGQCTDNARMESFFHSLKAELIRGAVFNGVKTLGNALSHYINKFYNECRLHSRISYLSPIEYECSVVV
ncbi:MAG: hypothetical protein CMN80_11920 [Spongiibacter sp.]|uniref:IS3 family transposase n=1 Tax=Spongiibacter sp. TaxID=2024860 RepID=UPI000C0A5B87|nr:hypothetical protein [Spongiibacter sp.]